ncbi:MAG: hypothetical protein WAW02_09835 [Sideroxyarcus sp.]
MANTVNIREKNKSFDLHISDELLEVYADGMGFAMLGYPMSKLTFHTVLPPKEGVAVEQRQAVVRVTMSTAALMEFCQNMLSTLEATKPQLLTAKTQFDNTFIALQSKLVQPTVSQEEALLEATGVKQVTKK